MNLLFCSILIIAGVGVSAIIGLLVTIAAIFVDLFTISNFMKSETLSFEREMRLFYSTTDLTVSQLNDLSVPGMG